MRTVIVTAGTGPEHEANAKRLVNHINKISKDVDGSVPAMDLSDQIPWRQCSYPPLCKLFVWQLLNHKFDRIVWIDTDCYVSRPILHDELWTDPFTAVRDPWICGGQLAREKKALTGERAIFHHIPSYFNSGFYCATRESIPVFDLAIEQEPRKFRKRANWVREQDLFNWAVWSVLGGMSPDNAGWNDAGEKWNCIASKRIDTSISPVVVHLAGWSATNKGRILKGLFSGKDLECVLSS
jgi:hypothetical protein